MHDLAGVGALRISVSDVPSCCNGNAGFTCAPQAVEPERLVDLHLLALLRQQVERAAQFQNAE